MPLVHSMEGRLFGRSEEQRRKQEEIKVRSLIRCETERQQLRSCFRNSWFGWCHKEQQIFWDCFTKERERLLAIQNQAVVPDNHWGDQDRQDPDSSNSSTKV